ncbi:MAG: hypothetical protein M1817_000210 [Caeruleum heppii]|nr:MAG: hypothetical protein M1817_000210 [Caeruleum heppii]
MSSSLFCLAGSGGAFTTRPGGTTVTGPVTNSAGIVTLSGSAATGTGNAGLSGGAKAGIGVGTTLGIVLLLCLIAGFWLLRRRHHHRHDGTARSSSQARDPATSQVPSPAPLSAGTDYFASEAQPGPFTHSDAAQASGMTPAYGTVGNRGAVPVRPEGPGDITSPVEMGQTGMPSPGARSELSDEATVTPRLEQNESTAAGYFRPKNERPPSPAELP